MSLSGEFFDVADVLVTDEQWKKIEPLLPAKPRGIARVDDRRVLSGIIHVLKNGGRWADRGVWQRITR